MGFFDKNDIRCVERELLALKMFCILNVKIIYTFICQIMNLNHTKS
jgi:hypothetical protein